MRIQGSDSVPGRVSREPLFSVSCVMFYSPIVSIRARNVASPEGVVASSPNCARWFTPAILGREATQRKDRSLWTIWRLEARGWKLEATR